MVRKSRESEIVDILTTVNMLTDQLTNNTSQLLSINESEKFLNLQEEISKMMISKTKLIKKLDSRLDRLILSISQMNT